MKLEWTLFALLLGMCLVVGITMTIDEVEVSHGVAHPEFSAMQRGGSGVERHTPAILWLGWTLGVLEIVFFVCCLALGVSKRGSLGLFKMPLIIGAGVYLAVFTLMLLTYQGFMRADAPAQPFIFPAPTVVMLFGLTTAPLIFVFLYIANFDRWILRPEDLEEFQRILAAKRERDQKEKSA